MTSIGRPGCSMIGASRTRVPPSSTIRSCTGIAPRSCPSSVRPVGLYYYIIISRQWRRKQCSVGGGGSILVCAQNP